MSVDRIEAVEYVSRVTAHALYYAGADLLRHKLVVVDEQAGASEADYAVRSLQSKGLLRLAAPAGGGKSAKPITVNGPIALMSGSTSSDLNPENLSRCLELALDDGPEQTKRVQQAQARAWAGIKGKKIDVQVWHDAQRVLGEQAPIGVLIPFATRLSFPSRTTADRRGSAKLLGLVAAHATLNMRQRERDKAQKIVATVDDYRIVHELVKPIFAKSVDGLSPRAARVLAWLVEHGSAVDRRQVAEACGWVFNTSKKALNELCYRIDQMVQVQAQA